MQTGFTKNPRSSIRLGFFVSWRQRRFSTADPNGAIVWAKWGHDFGQVTGMRHVNYTVRPLTIDNAKPREKATSSRRATATRLRAGRAGRSGGTEAIGDMPLADVQPGDLLAIIKGRAHTAVTRGPAPMHLQLLARSPLESAAVQQTGRPKALQFRMRERSHQACWALNAPMAEFARPSSSVAIVR